MRGTGVGKLCVREADALEIRQMFAEFLQAFVADLAAAVADACELGEALKLGIRRAGDPGADKGEGFEVLESGEGLHARVGEFTVVCETQRPEVLQLAERFDPLIACFCGDDVERLQRCDVSQMLEEGRVIGIFFPMVVRPRTGHG